MKKRRKIYQDPWPEEWRQPQFKGTFIEVSLILLIDIVAIVYLGYRYYYPPKTVDVQLQW